MAKKKKVNDDEFDFDALASETDGEIIGKQDSVKYFVDTGSLALNYISSGKFITGGIPGGKLTEIFGPSSSCKSLFGNNILFGCQKLGGIAVLLDVENSANKEFMREASHCNVEKLLSYKPLTLERVFAKINSVSEKIRAKNKDIPIVFIYDSIGVSPCERELRECDVPEGANAAEIKRIVGGKEQPGERAKICSKEFRKLNATMEKLNITVVVLNQIRSKIGVMFGPSETTAGGGNALPFYASLRIRPQTTEKIEQKITAKIKKILGIKVRLENKKNKTHRPFIKSHNIQLLFDKGINPTSGLLSCLVDDNRLIMGKGSFTVKPEYTEDGGEYTFKGSLERNDIAVQVLLDCPKLIDAESSDQVREYLEPYRDAMEFKVTDDMVTKVFGEDDEESIDEELEKEIDLEE